MTRQHRRVRSWAGSLRRDRSLGRELRDRSGIGRLAQAVPEAQIVSSTDTGTVDIPKFPTDRKRAPTYARVRRISAAPMAGLTVYHRQGAGRPIRLVWTLEEARADYELVVMDAEQGKSAEHLARHPLGRVPALVDDEGPLFESTALCLHVAELYPDAGLLPPAGTHERARVQQWAIFAMPELEAPAIESYRQRETNPEASANAAERARKSAAVLEQALHGSPPRLVGDQLTVADIVAGSVLRMASAASASPSHHCCWRSTSRRSMSAQRGSVPGRASASRSTPRTTSQPRRRADRLRCSGRRRRASPCSTDTRPRAYRRL